MKRYSLLFVLACNVLVSQNLVLNSSFEMHNKCPSSIGGFETLVTSWSTPNSGSTDYFSSCSESIGYNNFFGEQAARSGQGYAGMYLMAPKDYREYIQGELSQTLIANKQYTFTFFISLSENSSHAIKDLGVLFLEKPLQFKSDQLIDVRKILNEIKSSYFIMINSYQFYSEKVNWEKVTFNYTAKGYEHFFIVGNFNNNKEITSIQIQKTKHPDASYYFIDDISLEPLNIEKPKATITYISETNSLEPNKVYTLKNVLFDFDDHKLKDESIKELDILNGYLKAHKSLNIEVYGHTDDIGTEKRNNELSIQRAKSVALYLISKGLKPERITIQGYGNRFPVTSNNTKTGRSLNRRVEFKLIEK